MEFQCQLDNQVGVTRNGFMKIGSIISHKHFLSFLSFDYSLRLNWKKTGYQLSDNLFYNFHNVENESISVFSFFAFVIINSSNFKWLRHHLSSKVNVINLVEMTNKSWDK